ncbi:MoxR family ATPase [bacterium]|nr:MoxR family ATPase [bacterium]
MKSELEQLCQTLDSVRQEVSKVVIGNEAVLDQALITIFTGHHALVEGVPGIAKTLMVRTLARILDCEFTRIQFTPDLMPADIIGTNVFNFEKNEFTLVKGPVFTTFLLADEINRAPAKTQSALLQAMQERLVTIDRTTHKLSQNFTVFATQNPIEYEGTYPLPEAQKDRFMMKIIMSYPNDDQELQLAQRMLGDDAPETTLERGDIRPLLKDSDIKLLSRTLMNITVREEMVRYMVNIVRKTRSESSILVGAGPRATQSLLLATRMLAVLNDRDYVTPDDVKSLVKPILAHRLILRPEFEIEGLNVEDVIERLLEEVTVPR